ncbi:MAG: redox-regulated ATPase YchF [Chitinivibrionales bacterium]|nr:redox-regulated ATPase YchF [Chitinivibrionales bacterium]
MKIGIIGLPNCGKTTLFNALTKSDAPVTDYADTMAEPHLGEVEVDDPRVTHLSGIYKPKKTIYAKIEMIDFVGMAKGSSKEQAISADVMRMIKNSDALAVVLRNFATDLEGEPTPQADLDAINEELLLSDLIIAEKRMEKIEMGFKKGQKTNELQTEHKALQKILDKLNAMEPIRELEFTEHEAKAIKGFQLLTQKPMLVIVNSNEQSFGKNNELLDSLNQTHKAIEFAGKFEMELSRLSDEEEIALFMEDIGITESARARLTQYAYELLGYISFFTVGDDEVRAWTISKGDAALTAAGTIHTDLMRGFIRAECFSYDDLIECGSEKGVKEKGKFRLEGKEYVVKDGDILNIRFNV